MIGEITLRPDFSDTTFAPFGAVVDRPTAIGQRNLFSRWLGGPDGLAPMLHTNAVAAVALPDTLTTLERHPHAAQCFLPIDVSRYLVVVAPTSPDGGPDLDAVEAFEVPGHLGVIYAQNVWHAPARTLDRTGHFAVLMWRGATDDDEFLEITPIRIHAEALVHQDRAIA